MKVDIDKFLCDFLKSIKSGTYFITDKTIKTLLAEQGLRFNGEKIVEIEPRKKDFVKPFPKDKEWPKEPQSDFKIEAGKWYVFTHASLHYDTMNGEVTFEKNKPYKAIGESTLLGDGGEYCFRGQEDMLKNLRPATDEEIIANNLSTIGSANVDPNIQEVINDHFDEMFDDEVPKAKFKVGDKIKLKSSPTYPPREIIKIENDSYYFDNAIHLPFISQDNWELVEPQSNAINILPNGIDIDSMMPNFEDGDWVVGFHTKISDVAKEFYRKGLEDMLQAIRKKG